MKDLLSTAEKNVEIARYYNELAEAEVTETEDLPQRIENVLYSLVNDYDEEELKVVQKIKYNEAIISARGDVATAQANYNAMFEEERKRKTSAIFFFPGLLQMIQARQMCLLNVFPSPL
jgi:hypothetical protein